MDAVLLRHPKLWEYLWDIGYQGVNSENFDNVMEYLPDDYKYLVSDEFVYNETPIDTPKDFEIEIQQKGFYKSSDNGAASRLLFAIIDYAVSARRYFFKKLGHFPR